MPRISSRVGPSERRPARGRRAIGPRVLSTFLLGIVWAAAAAAPAHYVVFELGPDGAVEPRFARVVQLDRAPASRTEEEARAAARAGDDTVVLRLTAPDGTVVHRDVVVLPRWIRGEFRGEPLPGGGFSIDAHRVEAERVPFVVRLPLVEGSLLSFDGAARGRFDPAALAAETASRGALDVFSGARVVGAAPEGPSANRVDLLIMGDGYTAAQEQQFAIQSSQLIASFFQIVPYLDYQGFYRVTSLFTPSNEAGADHPPYEPDCPGTPSCCAATAAQYDPLAGTFVDTAFGARYCASNIFRLLVVDGSAVLAAASAAPDWDRILVLVNDSTYGGSGGFLSVASTHPQSVEVARHEYGHSFTGLADEYETPYPGFPACSDVGGGSPCEPNVTDEQVAGLIKWAPWIAPTTPVPTPETSEYDAVVGLFEGARYRTTGMYRPRNNGCLMRALGKPFGQVCRQEYVLELYRGGWGVPEDGIDPIEPGSESPPPGPVTTSGPLTLSFDLVDPPGSHGSTLEVSWTVDGQPQPTPSPPESFEFVPPGPGCYEVRVEVVDATNLVHPDLEGDALTSGRTWTVEADGAGPPGDAAALTVRRAPGSAGELVLEWTEGCAGAAGDYGIYEGDLGDWDSHGAADCEDDDGSPLSETISPRSGSAYYLVVPHGAGVEGSYGTTSSGLERPAGTTACAPVRQTGCP